MTRNPNRTTKPERRLIRRRNPTMCRILGVAQAARWHRDGWLLDEAKAFESMAADILYGRPPADLDARVNTAIDALAAALDVRRDALTPTSSNVNHYSGGPVDIPTLTPRFAPIAHLVGNAEAEPLGPSACGHYEVVDMTPRAGLADDGAAAAEALAEAYESWDGDPWRDPDEVTAMRAEAIERELNDDHDPGD